MLVTAVSTAAFAQALKMVRRKGTVTLVGLPPGEFPTPIFDVVLKRITVRGSIVGTSYDLDEAVAFAAAKFEPESQAAIDQAEAKARSVLTDPTAGRVTAW